MKVLNCIPDPRVGGPHRRAIDIAKELRKYDVETTFLIPNEADRFVTLAEDNRFEFVTTNIPRVRSPEKIMKNLQFLARFRSTASKIRDIIDTRRIDIAHVNGPLTFPPAYATKSSRAKLVWHFNDTLTPTPIKQLAAFAARAWAQEIVVASDAVASYYFSSNVDTKTVYAPVDTRKFDKNEINTQKSIRDELDIDNDTIVLGAVGNISPTKGYEYLIDAVKKVKNYHKNVKLLIAGSRLDSQEDYYQCLISRIHELNLEQDIVLLGYRDDISQILAEIDIFVLSSVSEACPIVVLEAMSMSTAVVATRVGGVTEQIPGPEYGWTTIPESPTDLAKKIIQAIENPEQRKKRAQSARQRVCRHFSIPRVSRDQLNVYENL